MALFSHHITEANQDTSVALRRLLPSPPIMLAAGSRSALIAKSANAPPVLLASRAPTQQRYTHDLIIKRKTGQPIVKSGPYGGGR